jgi:hypothetical protein
LLDQNALARLTRAIVRSLLDQLTLEVGEDPKLDIDQEKGLIVARMPYDGRGYETAIIVNVNVVNVPMTTEEERVG